MLLRPKTAAAMFAALLLTAPIGCVNTPGTEGFGADMVTHDTALVDTETPADTLPAPDTLSPTDTSSGPVCSPLCTNGICVEAPGGGTTCLCDPGFVLDAELGCLCVQGPCSGTRFGGFSATTGAMSAGAYRLDFQLAPATMSFQAAGGTIRLYGTVIPQPQP